MTHRKIIFPLHLNFKRVLSWRIGGQTIPLSILATPCCKTKCKHCNSNHMPYHAAFLKSFLLQIFHFSIDSNSNSSSNHVECSPNIFLGIFTVFRRPKSFEHAVEIKLETEVPWQVFDSPLECGAEKYLQRKATALANRSCNLYWQISGIQIP